MGRGDSEEVLVSAEQLRAGLRFLRAPLEEELGSAFSSLEPSPLLWTDRFSVPASLTSLINKCRICSLELRDG